jgi:FkbM family methyltransferase
VAGTRYGGTWSKVIPGPQLYEHGSVRRVSRDGINYELDLSCLMQWYVYWGQTEVQRDRLYSMVSPGDVVLDVGTNIGETLLNFAKITGETGFVYGFEPDQENYSNVEKNIGLNAFNNVYVFALGVSDKKEQLRLFRVDPHNLGMNRVLSEAESAKFDNYTVIETDTLDNIVTQNKFERVDVIKLDIEGYEMHALRGAVETLRRFRPKLFIEVGYSRLISNGTSPNEMVELLTGLGYIVRHAETDEEIMCDYDFSPLGDGGIDVYAVAR